MKTPDKRWTIRLGALALTGALLGTVAARSEERRVGKECRR